MQLQKIILRKKRFLVKEKMITQSTIIHTYGWTKSLISKFLPAPKLVQNPYYKSASPMQLWKEEDVKQVMQTQEFQAAMGKAKKRKESAAKAVSTKKEVLEKETMDFLNSIQVKILPDELLCEKTLEKKRAWFEVNQLERYGYIDPSDIPDVDAVDEDTLNRWVVNYIRHNLVRYDSFLNKIHGKVGVQDAYSHTKIFILEKIAKAYPKYAKECQRQISDFLYKRELQQNYFSNKTKI